ncbi:serine/threonine-protein kinase pakF [Cynara cardunculus var. scolymus]|uniref:serine/threonine-protein kinase pakF n=1 Tax=Cynara cardunculus var. scolymus TaxID=59895 RepID=UPI000D62ED57|nr:serine/threonine-protein kinase pakF [Cynara cardunculus var. scolymus]
MWSTATLSCRFGPPAIATRNQGPFTVSASARYSRPRKNINYDYDEDEEEEEDEERDNQNTWKQEEIRDLEEQPKISGSVVLLALQKASAKKTSKKLKKKSKTMKPEQGDACSDYSDVKPLCIKSDWKDRLDELETQLHQLIHNT